jgi:hypothetical protein
MSHKWNDEHLTQAVIQSLDAAANQLDAASRQRLQMMRQQALQPRRRLSQFFTSPSYSWVTASIGLVTLSLILWGMPLHLEPKPPVTTTPLISQTGAEAKYTESELNNMDVIMSNEELDFLENLDMYEWLATHV